MKKRKYTIALAALLAILLAVLTGCGESWKREVKSWQSEHTGGLNRTVTVYSYDGTPIKSWSGKFDVSESENETYFDIDDKRVIIQGGIIINEED